MSTKDKHRDRDTINESVLFNHIVWTASLRGLHEPTT